MMKIATNIDIEDHSSSSCIDDYGVSDNIHDRDINDDDDADDGQNDYNNDNVGDNIDDDIADDDMNIIFIHMSRYNHNRNQRHNYFANCFNSDITSDSRVQIHARACRQLFMRINLQSHGSDERLYFSITQTLDADTAAKLQIQPDSHVERQIDNQIDRKL